MFVCLLIDDVFVCLLIGLRDVRARRLYANSRYDITICILEYSSGIMDTVLHWWRLDIDVLLRYAASWPPGSPEPYTHTSFPQNCLRSSSSFE